MIKVRKMKKYVRIPVGVDVYRKLVRTKKEVEKQLGFTLTWDQFFNSLFRSIELAKEAAKEIAEEYKDKLHKHTAS